MQDVDTAEGGRRWQPWAWIVAACALAHGWCLGSQFYMDDFPQIVDRAGDFSGPLMVKWTNLGYAVQHRLFGTSAVGFHAVNWLLHTAISCVLYGFGRELLRGKWPAGVALCGALLFAVHPLGSEIPNYVRTQDLAWVTLFSLLAGWSLLAFLRGGGFWRLAGCVAFVAGAAISKGPGLFHAGMVCAAVALMAVTPAHRDFLRSKWCWLAAAVVLAICGLWLLNHWVTASARWSEPRFVGHAFTLARVFWEFAWRAVVPVALSADHGIAETLVPPGARFWNLPDKVALLAMAAMLALAAFSGWLAWRERTRLFGICLALFVGTILFRMAFLIPEFMPEYRIYPGLPWFCLGAAILLTAAWRRLFGEISPALPLALLLGVFALLSAKRSFLWHDLDPLMADVLKQYPPRVRALWQLSNRDVTAGNWPAVIERQQTLWPAVERSFIEENRRLAPAREVPSGDFVLAMVALHGRYAYALAHQQSPAAGLRVMAQLEAQMKLMRMTEKAKPLEWSYFHHDKGLILEVAGNLPAAAAALRRKLVARTWPADLKRVETKLAALKPGS